MLIILINVNVALVYNKNDRFVEKAIGDEMVLVPLSDNVADMNKVYTLNDVGSFIYNRIDGIKSIKELHRELVDNYEVNEVEALADINNFITEMVSKGVLFTKQ